MERRIQGGFRRLLPGKRSESLADVLGRERIAAEPLRVLDDERLRRPRRLVVAVDRRRLPVPRQALVGDRDVHHIGEVGRFARDDEGFRKPETDDLGVDLHRSQPIPAYLLPIETT